MRTDKITSFDFSFGQIFKMSLAVGFGLFGGSQLISGYWVLGFISCGLGAIFAQDSSELLNKLFDKSSQKTEPVKPALSDNPTQGLVEELNKEPKKESKKEDITLKAVVSSDKKQKNQSESRHNPVPTLNLASASSRPVTYTPLAAADSEASTPTSGELSRKKRGQRLSQKPTIEEMQTVRAMTEDEVEELAALPSPKQTEKKQVTIKTIPKK